MCRQCEIVLQPPAFTEHFSWRLDRAGDRTILVVTKMDKANQDHWPNLLGLKPNGYCRMVDYKAIAVIGTKCRTKEEIDQGVTAEQAVHWALL